MSSTCQLQVAVTTDAEHVFNSRFLKFLLKYKTCFYAFIPKFVFTTITTNILIETVYCQMPDKGAA